MVILKDIDLINDIDKYDVILVGTNCYCNMSKGFQQKIRYYHYEVFELNLKTKYGDSTKIGKRVSTKSGKTIFSLCFIAKGFDFSKNKGKDYLDYNGLKNCLKTANNEYSGLKVATTIMGCEYFDGNGDKAVILKLMEECTPKLDLYVYDYKQKSTQEECFEKIMEINKECNGDKKMFRKKYQEYKNSLPKHTNSTIGLKNRLKNIREQSRNLLDNK